MISIPRCSTSRTAGRSGRRLRAPSSSEPCATRSGGGEPSIADARRTLLVSTGRRRPMRRIGELIPDAARALGLEDELRLARAMSTFEAIVAERVPAAAGACRVVGIVGFAID